MKIISSVLPFPQRIVVELTPQFNLACRMCPRHLIYEHDGFMDEVLWKRIIDEVKSINQSTIDRNEAGKVSS